MNGKSATSALGCGMYVHHMVNGLNVWHVKRCLRSALRRVPAWGLLVRSADIDSTVQHVRGSERFFANLALRVAVLATAVPIINAQVLSDPGWTGTLSDYIRLGSLVGGAAIAATPSLRAIVSNLGPRR